MSTNAGLQSQGRRAFLKGLGAAGGALGVGLGVNAHAAPAQGPAAEPEPRKRGYRETEHVREYYAKAAL